MGSHRPSRKRSLSKNAQRKNQFKNRGSVTYQLKATVDKNWRGFAFLLFEKRGLQDLFVPPNLAADLFQGDRVEVVIDGSGKLKNIKVLEHRFREIVGRFNPERAKGSKAANSGWIIYERKKTRIEIYVPNVSIKVRDQEWVRAKLHFPNKGRGRPTGEILETLGDEIPASKDVWLIAAEYNLKEEHKKETIDEAKGFGTVIQHKDLTGREDLVSVPFFTIDSETARDFDDAIHVERSSRGYDLWVAIADVSHYVREDQPLDEEARARGTSVYFPERAFHMLPRELSENLCSLRPNEPRLSMVVKIAYDKAGHRGAISIMEAVIQSRRRATYNQIEAEWKQERDNAAWPLAPHFELYQIMRKQRTKRGSLDFELPEAEISVDSNGEVISIRNRPRLEAHRLIEEFMIAANEAVTSWMMQKKWPFIYRVHEKPSAQGLERFRAVAGAFGIKVTMQQLESPKTTSELLRTLEEHPAQGLLNMALLRSLKQAVYSSVHGIHYGLASEAYTHFTSPIRRYPDLVVHRLIKSALKSRTDTYKSKKGNLEAKLGEISEHCSYRERLAADAERDSIKLKQVRIMLARVGEEYVGKVVGMIEVGFFVQLADPFVEGMVPLESTRIDEFKFDEDKMLLLGRRTKKVIKMGATVQVKVVKVDMDRREIEFNMIADKNL